jgi:hypothetical protein
MTRRPAVERLPEVKLGRHSCSRRFLEEKEFAFDTKQFGDIPVFLVTSNQPMLNARRAPAPIRSQHSPIPPGVKAGKRRAIGPSPKQLVGPSADPVAGSTLSALASNHHIDLPAAAAGRCPTATNRYRPSLSLRRTYGTATRVRSGVGTSARHVAAESHCAMVGGRRKPWATAWLSSCTQFTRGLLQALTDGYVTP